MLLEVLQKRPMKTCNEMITNTALQNSLLPTWRSISIKPIFKLEELRVQSVKFKLAHETLFH